MQIGDNMWKELALIGILGISGVRCSDEYKGAAVWERNVFATSELFKLNKPGSLDFVLQSQSIEFMELYKKRLLYIREHMINPSKIEELYIPQDAYETPYALVAYITGNAPRIHDHRKLKDGPEDYPSRTYTITLDGNQAFSEAEVDSLEKELKYPLRLENIATCTFYDATINKELGEHLMFQGPHVVNGTLFNIQEAMYDIENPHKSYVHFSTGTIFRQHVAAHFLKKVIELYLQENLNSCLKTINFKEKEAINFVLKEIIKNE